MAKTEKKNNNMCAVVNDGAGFIDILKMLSLYIILQVI